MLAPSTQGPSRREQTGSLNNPDNQTWHGTGQQRAAGWVWHCAMAHERWDCCDSMEAGLGRQGRVHTKPARALLLHAREMHVSTERLQLVLPEAGPGTLQSHSQGPHLKA